MEEGIPRKPVKVSEEYDIHLTEVYDFIGVSKEELERNGDLERLLNGEPVNVISLNLTLLGIEITMDATLQIVEDNNVPMLEICSIKPE